MADSPAPRILGRLTEFNPQSDNISSYLEHLELYFEANAIEDARKVPVLLTVIGARAYDTLRSLLSPMRPQDKSFADLLTVLGQHFDPKPLVIGEHFHFYKRSQRATESVAEFQADLRKLSIRCEFGDFLDQAIRDSFVCGVKSDTIQKKLLAEDGLTAARALEIAQSIEAADKNARELKANEHSISGEEELLHFARAEGKDCWHCGHRHNEKTCKFRGATCHKCGKLGHIAPVCRSVARLIDKKGQHPRPRFSNKSTRRSKFSSTKWLGTDDCCKEAPNEELNGWALMTAARKPLMRS